MLSQIWEILTYSHGVVGSTLAILPIIGAAIGGIGSAFSGQAGRAKNRRQRAVGMRWGGYGAKTPEKVGGDLFTDIVGGVTKGAGIGTGLGAAFAPAAAASAAPTMTAAEAAKDVAMKGVGAIQSSDPTAKAFGRSAARPMMTEGQAGLDAGLDGLRQIASADPSAQALGRKATGVGQLYQAPVQAGAAPRYMQGVPK